MFYQPSRARSVYLLTPVVQKIAGERWPIAITPKINTCTSFIWNGVELDMNVELEMCTRKTRFELFLTFFLFGTNFVQQSWHLLPSVVSDFNLIFVILLLWILSGYFNCRYRWVPGSDQNFFVPTPGRYGICRKNNNTRILKPEKILDMNQKGKNRIDQKTGYV